MNIGHAIHEIRKEKGLKQETVALGAGTNTGHLSRIEQGARQPSLQMLERLAIALGVTTTELISRAEGGSEPVESPESEEFLNQCQILQRRLSPQNKKLAIELLRTIQRFQD
jgi:transcriptional regulator with XRE-family HTH domain